MRLVREVVRVGSLSFFSFLFRFGGLILNKGNELFEVPVAVWGVCFRALLLG